MPNKLRRFAEMPVTYVIRFEVVADRIDHFLSLLSSLLDAIREEPNLHQSILHRDPDAPHRFMLYETWEDHDDVLKVQLSRPYRQAWHDALPELLAAPRDISVWQPLRTDQGRREVP
jgi:(4S)-4-hydroxy-5-phosphonooxypentane-2,3-dione isomerase